MNNRMTTKKFRLRADEIAPLIDRISWCLATDRIMVDGALIGYMYREEPKAGGDSGWRFFAGDEDDAYMASNDNHGVYDLNTVVNYDPAVIPFLDATPGSRFDRTNGNTYVKLD